MNTMSETTESVKTRKFPVWAWFYVAFLVLFTAWYFLFKTAYQNQPETVPLEHLKIEKRQNSETH